jgi:hypothetical protein
MRRLTLLGITCGVAVYSLALGQHPLHIAQHHAMMRHQAAMYQAAMMYHAAMVHQQAVLQRQQAAIAQQAWRKQAAWHAKARKPASVVVRPSTTGSVKKATVAQPVIVAGARSSSVHQSRPEVASQDVIKTKISSQTQSLAAGSHPTSFMTRFRETEQINPSSGDYVLKERWTDKWIGPAEASLKESISETQRTSFRSGKEVIKDQWSEKIVSSPGFTYLPLQVQLAQLEYLLPYQPWYFGTYPQKGSMHTKITWPGGIQTVSAKFVDRYDTAGRFLGAQVQVKDSVKGQPASSAALSPQAQLNYLEATTVLGSPYAVLDPFAYPWVYPYFAYGYGWPAFDRFAVVGAVPIW